MEGISKGSVLMYLSAELEGHLGWLCCAVERDGSGSYLNLHWASWALHFKMKELVNQLYSNKNFKIK